MTHPTAREMAEKLGKKAVSDDYIEDGGYIRDWLVDDIEQALTQFAEAQAMAGKLYGPSVLETIEKAKRDSFAECRKRAAKIIDHLKVLNTLIPKNCPAYNRSLALIIELEQALTPEEKKP
jgi:hypothetical protein